MDPRIARRWVEVRRDQGRRRLRILVALGAVVAAAALFVGSLYTPIFKVRHVRVAVEGSVPSSQVATLSGINGHTLMIGVDDSAVERRLDAVPNLGQARVATHWPGTVSIRVAVRDAVAVIPAGSAQPATQSASPSPSAAPSHWAEIDRTGRVISLVSIRPAGLPQLLGIGAPPPGGQWVGGSAGPSATVSAAGRPPLVDMNAASASQTVPTGPAAMLAIASALPPQIRQSVGAITASNTNVLSLTVAATEGSAGPLTVALGDGSQLAKKLTALTTLLTQTDLTGVNGLDLTVPDRPAALTAQKSPDSLSTHAEGSH
jgi:hypothetical protein